MDWSVGYREQAPPAALAGPVACVWASVAPSGDPPLAPGEAAPGGVASGDGPVPVWNPLPGLNVVNEGARADRRPSGAGGASVLVLPDGCVDIIWQRGTGVFVAGPDTGPVPAAMPAGTVMAGVRFAPGAAGAALDLPLRGLLNQRVAAGDLGSPAWTRLARRAGGSLPPDEALRELLAATAAMIGRGESDRLVAAAARRLGRPGAGVAEVAGDLGVSERQLRRRCQAAVGYGPATLRRVLRFRRFVDWADSLSASPGGPASGGAARGAGLDLASAAARFGYADQAHLSRDCAEFSGLTPTALTAARSGSQRI